MASIYDWSLTAGDNATADADINWAENQLPYTVNDSARQMMARIKALINDLGGAVVAGGSANAITLTMNNAFSAYTNGMLVAFRASNTNTDGGTTININSIGSKALKVYSASAERDLVAGQITSGGIYLAAYSSAANSGAGAFLLLTPSLSYLRVPSGNSGAPAIAAAADSNTGIYWDSSDILGFTANGTLSTAIYSGGLMVGTTTPQSPTSTAHTGVTITSTGVITASANGAISLRLQRTSSDGPVAQWFRNTTGVGSISITGSATAYNTSSDYRLKEHITDLLGSGARIDALRPRSGTWKADGTPFRGFLAHEFAEVYPRAVSGEKDAVDEDGNPIMQAMDAGTPETIADIIAELQSLRQRVAALEGN